ncbi:unnamed protein product [Vicia faba]|uniref:Uncharacterized protein n=1 Tax=Vicia faba TaxID=3906 RepID=A0AAV0YF69_VICFA|nr:unnamed protein product [Vicia faba]
MPNHYASLNQNSNSNGTPKVFHSSFNPSPTEIGTLASMLWRYQKAIAGFNSTLWLGNVGKRRDVGLNHIALFEGKVAGGIGEQVGVECDYRHNEIVRLNPRDCWYWLSVNCLNLTCAFRHPVNVYR